MREQLVSLGGELNKIMISEFLPGNNEYVATEDIKKGDMVGYIPREMFLTFDEAKKMSTNTQYLRERNLLE